MKFELNDLTPLLDLLAQPAFCTEDGVVCYCNRPARDRGLKTGVSARPPVVVSGLPNITPTFSRS